MRADRRALVLRLPRVLRSLHLRAAQRGEEGFILLESIVAISLITVIMGALASFTLNAVTGTNELRARQGAAQLATSTMANIGLVPVTDLKTGRSGPDVTAQFRRAELNEPAVAAWLTTMDQVGDGSPAGAGATATLPTQPVAQTLNNITYNVSTYLGSCVAVTTASASPTALGSSTDCVKSGTGITGVTQLRVVVAVTWSGRGCRVTAGCTYVTATLFNGDPDPIFNTNRATPPTRPVVASPGNQITTVGATESLQLTIQPGTGLAPLTWQITSGTLPIGLSMSADGLITGSPTTRAPSTSLTATVSDAFGRTATTTFTWTIVDPPTITTPAAQSSTRGQAVSLAVASTCPRTACTFTLTGAPAGLTIDATTGAISGTPTTGGTFPAVTVTITDADGVAATTAPFTWVVLDPATIGTIGTLQVTVGVSVDVPLTYTCPTTPCTITLAGSVPGVGLSAVPGRTLVNPTTALTVNATSGTVYLSGTPVAAAVPTGTSRAYTLRATITDTRATSVPSSGVWTATVPALTNYALLRPATQSSTTLSADPGRAVDGNTDGTFANNSVTHTLDSAQPWWQVDLGASTTVRTVKLFNRTDCCGERLANGRVFLSNADMTGKTYAQLVADPNVAELPFTTLTDTSLALAAGDVRARYVRVQLAGSNMLSLAEVQVLGPNLASGKPATQSSTNFSGDSSRAVDGNIDSVYNNGSISHTDFQSQPWWQVDLGASSTIDAVTIWNRTDCCGDRLNGAYLLLSPTDMTGRTATQLYSDNSVTKILIGTPGARITLAGGQTTARYVRIQLPGTTGTEVVSLAEVQVNGTVR